MAIYKTKGSPNIVQQSPPSPSGIRVLLPTLHKDFTSQLGLNLLLCLIDFLYFLICNAYFDSSSGKYSTQYGMPKSALHS